MCSYHIKWCSVELGVWQCFTVMPNLLHDSDSDEDDERKNSKLWSTRHTTFFFPGAGQLFIGKHFLDGDIVQNGD